MINAENRLRMVELWQNWHLPREAAYVEPTRTGTPRGMPVGLSKTKWVAAQKMLLLRAGFTLKELAAQLGVGYQVLLNWRTQPLFRQVMAEAERDFKEYLREKITETKSPAELLNCLPWFYSYFSEFQTLIDDLIIGRGVEKPSFASLRNLLKFLAINNFSLRKLSKLRRQDLYMVSLLLIELVILVISLCPNNDDKIEIIQYFEVLLSG